MRNAKEKYRVQYLKNILKISITIIIVILFLILPLNNLERQQTLRESSQPHFIYKSLSNNSSSSMVQLPGNIPFLINNTSFASALKNVSPANSSKTLNIEMYLSLQNLSNLYNLSQNISSPVSNQYHQFMNPAQFRNKYYPSKSEIASIMSYYQNLGFKVWQYSYSPLMIILNGTISIIESAFHLKLYNFHWSPTNITFISNEQNPSIPKIFQNYILHIYGMSYSSLALFNPSQSNNFKTSFSPSNLSDQLNVNSLPLTPTNLRSYYGINNLISSGYSGQNESIGILGVGESFDYSSVDSFFSHYNIPIPRITQINLTNNGKNPYSEGMEADLDVEWAGSMAPSSHIYDIMSPFNLTGIGNNAINLELYYYLNKVDPNIISGSWAELQFHHDSGFASIYSQIGLQAVMEGTTMFLGSGDSYNINYMTVMTSQYIVSVGGVYTALGNSGQISSQSAWYCPPGNWYGGALGSGGGSNYFFNLPSYQHSALISVPSTIKTRGEPDISMPSANLITDYQGRFITGSGTSYATPISAGAFADIESFLASKMNNSYSRLGWIQPLLYSLGYHSYYGYNAFFKVSNLQSGNWPNSGKYLGSGWNSHVGIGSLQVYNLAKDIMNYLGTPNPALFFKKQIDSNNVNITWIKSDYKNLNATLTSLSLKNATLSTLFGNITINESTLHANITSTSKVVVGSQVTITTLFGNLTGKVTSITDGKAYILTNIGIISQNVSSIRVIQNTSSYSSSYIVYFLILSIISVSVIFLYYYLNRVRTRNG
ncbi:MAG: S53 family peptidase [Thermoplasmataceae archaeon]